MTTPVTILRSDYEGIESPESHGTSLVDYDSDNNLRAHTKRVCGRDMAEEEIPLSPSSSDLSPRHDITNRLQSAYTKSSNSFSNLNIDYDEGVSESHRGRFTTSILRSARGAMFLKAQGLDKSCPNLGEEESRKVRGSISYWTHPRDPSELLSEKNGTLLHSENINDEEDAEGDDPILYKLDRLEDEIDTHTTDMLPLSVQLALEQNLFGWSNLTADIFNHLLFTLGAALVAYYFTSWLLLNNSHHPILQWLQWYTREEASASSDGTKVFGEPIWNMSRHLFEIIRTFITITAAVIAFRTVRRRRRVWLHSAYGTSAYERDALRRKISIKEVDHTTLLGKVRARWRNQRDASKARKIAKKLKRARSRFEKKRLMKLRQDEASREQKPSTGSSKAYHDDCAKRRFSNESLTISTVATISAPLISPLRTPSACSVSDPHSHPAPKTVLQDQMPISEIEILPYAHGGFFGAAPFMLGDPFWVNVLCQLMPDVYVEVAKRIFAPTPKLIHWAENNPVVAAYGTMHERECHGRIVTLEWDVFLDPYLVDRVVEAIDNLDNYQGDDELMREALRGNIQSCAILLLEKMLIAHGSTLQLMLEQTGYGKRYNFSRIKRQRRTLGGGIYARQWLAVYAHAVKMAMDYKPSLSSEEDERIVPSVAEFVNSEALPLTQTESNASTSSYDSDYSTASVSADDENETADLLMFPVKLGIKSAPSSRRSSLKSYSEITIPSSTMNMLEGKSTGARRATSLKSACFYPSTNMVESIQLIQSLLGSSISLVLDLKSRHVPKEVWALVVDSLRDCGARVEGVASFTVAEIRGISECCVEPCKEIMFFHSAGDLQKACHEGLLKEGDTVFFNAGSLLWDVPVIQTLSDCVKFARSCTIDYHVNSTKKYLFKSYVRMGQHRGSNNASEADFMFSTDMTRGTLAEYKDHYKINIGLYCQEFAIDDAAIDMIVRLVNSYPDVFNLGLSWGGVNGYTVKGIQPTRFTNTDGFWNQRYVGESWDYSLRPGEEFYSNVE